MLRPDFESFKMNRNPTQKDYGELLSFTESTLNLLHKERKARSALSKKNKKMAAKLAE